MKAVEPNHHVICLKLHFKKVYMLWISDDDLDTLLVDDRSKIIGFLSEPGLRKYAEEQRIEIFDQSPMDYDFGVMQRWLLTTESYFDCDDFLDIWNLFTDVAATLNCSFLGNVKDEITNSTYKKVFNGSGIFISEDPDPVFSMAERIKLKEVMQDGLATLFNNLHIIKETGN